MTQVITAGFGFGQVPYYLERLKCAFRTAVVSAFSRPVAILSYHRVNQPGTCASNLTVSIDRFREQMRALRDHFTPVPLKQLGQIWSGGSWPAKPPVVVTFDDGYQDTFLNALPIMNEYQISASVFVTTGFIDRQAEFWWDELEQLLIHGVEQKRWKPAMKNLEKALGVDGLQALDREQTYLRLTWLVKNGRQVRDRMAGALEILRKESGCQNPLCRQQYLAMTRSQLKELAQHSNVEIGAHTVSHPCLARLTEEEQYQELSQSKQFLEEELGISVESVAYPYGFAGSFNRQTRAVAKSLGFRYGLTTVPGVAWKWGDRYSLPRMFVQDWTGEVFSKKLRRFFWTG